MYIGEEILQDNMIKECRELTDMLTKIVGVKIAAVLTTDESDLNHSSMYSLATNCKVQITDEEIIKLFKNHGDKISKTKSKVKPCKIYHNQLNLTENENDKNNNLFFIDYPIYRPDNKVFASLCLFDNRVDIFDDKQRYMIQKFIDMLELKIENYYLKGKHISAIKQFESTDKFDQNKLDYQKLDHKKFDIDKQIKDKYQKFRYYIQNAPVGIFTVDREGNFVEVNKMAQEITGYSEEDILQMSVFDLVINRTKGKKLFKNFFKREKINVEGEFVNESGNYFYAKINGIKLDSNHLLGFVEDVTKRVKIEKKLKRQKAYFEQLFHESTEGIVLLDNNGFILKVNKSFEKMFGYSEDEIKRRNIHDLITPEEKREERILHSKLLNEDKYIKKESIRKTKNGERIHVLIHGFPIKLEGGQIGIYGLYHDITKRKEEEKKIRYLSFHDQLTGLYNRRYFENEMKRLNNSRRLPISIMVVDIDDLKGINDFYGHKQGDQHIIKAAEILESVTREEDIVARMGGDEFAILLPEADSKIADKICKRISKECKESNGEMEIPLNFSVGHASKKNEKDNLDDVFVRADQRMYADKRKCC